MENKNIGLCLRCRILLPLLGLTVIISVQTKGCVRDPSAFEKAPRLVFVLAPLLRILEKIY